LNEPIWSNTNRFFRESGLLLTPSFRELYETQLVDEGESLKVSDMSHLFTYLKQSTPLYERLVT